MKPEDIEKARDAMAATILESDDPNREHWARVGLKQLDDDEVEVLMQEAARTGMRWLMDRIQKPELEDLETE